MMEFIGRVLQQALLITGFVFTMMMLIEYLNVLSQGKWMDKLKKSPVGQVLTATVLGMIPGCLGTYTVVSLYTHKLLSFGALTAALIATAGDEAFMMIALIPKQAIYIIVGTAVVGLITGLLIDRFYKRSHTMLKDDFKFEIHHHDKQYISLKSLSLKNFSFSKHRLIALVVFGFFIVAPFAGWVEHNHEVLMPGIQIETHNHDADCNHNHDMHSHNHHHIDWLGISLAFCAALGFLISLLSSAHFLEDHIWKHLIKKHLFKVFIWTLLALVLIQLMLQYTDFSMWISANLFLVLLLAVLVGVIPESGPHLVFLSMFVSGSIPLSILLANSIVQDGHGALPLFAESKRSFFVTKAINMVVGLLVGGLGLLFGV